jgi:hypothetical protein
MDLKKQKTEETKKNAEESSIVTLTAWMVATDMTLIELLIQKGIITQDEFNTKQAELRKIVLKVGE